MANVKHGQKPMDQQKIRQAKNYMPRSIKIYFLGQRFEDDYDELTDAVEDW